MENNSDLFAFFDNGSDINGFSFPTDPPDTSMITQPDQVHQTQREAAVNRSMNEDSLDFSQRQQQQFPVTTTTRAWVANAEEQLRSLAPQQQPSNKRQSEGGPTGVIQFVMPPAAAYTDEQFSLDDIRHLERSISLPTTTTHAQQAALPMPLSIPPFSTQRSRTQSWDDSSSALLQQQQQYTKLSSLQAMPPQWREQISTTTQTPSNLDFSAPRRSIRSSTCRQSANSICNTPPMDCAVSAAQQNLIVQGPAPSVIPELTAGNHQRVLVHHSYHDRSVEDTVGDQHRQYDHRRVRGTTIPFPDLLYTILKDPENRLSITWQPHGRAFLVQDPQRFATDVMPHYFRNHARYTSFQRQLSLYGFLRLSRRNNPDFGAYYHEYFLRGHPSLCRHITRTRVKGHAIRPSSQADSEPDFYSMPYVGVNNNGSVSNSRNGRIPAIQVSSRQQQPSCTRVPDTGKKNLGQDDDLELDAARCILLSDAPAAVISEGSLQQYQQSQDAQDDMQGQQFASV